MARLKRLASSLLLTAGLALVFAGLSAAFGFTPAGIIASGAAIVALLYAGGIWFSGAHDALAPAGAHSILVFDRALRVASGAAHGTSILSQFPEPLRPEIDMRCRAALGGEHAHFACEHRGRRIAFDVAPVHTGNGMILYGVLISGAGAPASSLAAAPLTTVA